MPTKRTDVAARLTAETSAFERGLDRAGSSVNRLAGKTETASKRMKKAMRDQGFGNVAARIKTWGTSIAAFAGVYGLGQAIHAVREFEDSLADLNILGRKTKDIGWIDKARNKMLQISNDTGIAKEGLALFANKFVELTGDADTAVDSLERMAKVSIGLNANMGDLAVTMEQISGGFQIKGSKDLMDAMGILSYQALKGQMSFKNIAAAMPQVIGAAAALGPQAMKKQGVRDVGALFQLGIRTAGGPEETKTGVRRFLMELSQKRAKIEGLTGEQLTTSGPGGKMQFKTIQQMTKMLAKQWSEADLDKRAKLEKIFDARAQNILKAAGQAWSVGWTKSMGSRAAASVLFGAKGAGAADLEEIFRQRMQTPGAKIRRAMAQVTNRLYTALLPALVKLSKHAGTLGKMLIGVINNFQQLAAIFVAWKIGKFIAAVRQFRAATGGGAGAGLGGTTTATMNVRAATVNIMGGTGGVKGGGTQPTPVPGGGGGGKPQPGGGGKRTWWQTMATGMGGTALGMSTGTLAFLAPFFDWKAGETSKAFRSRQKESDIRQKKQWAEGGYSWYHHNPLTSWMFAGGERYNFAQELGLGGAKADVKEPDYNAMANVIAGAVERAIQNATIKATVATSSADKISAKANSKAVR